MSFFWKRPVRGRNAIAVNRRGAESRTIPALALTLLSFVLLTSACTQNPGASSNPASTSPLVAATSAPIDGEPIEGEPALSDPGAPAAAAKASVSVVGEPEVAAAPTLDFAEETIEEAIEEAIEEPTSTVADPIAATATSTAKSDLTALLEQPVATEESTPEPILLQSTGVNPASTEIVASATNEARTGALSGAAETVSSTLTPTVRAAVAAGGIMARLAAMNSASTATAEAAATSAPVDAQVTSGDTVPELPPAPAVAPAASTGLGTDPSGEVAWDGTERTLNVPILMYHYLSDPPPGADAIRRDLSVSPQRFAEHLDRLQEEGYTTISLYTLMAALDTGAPLPEKPVVLTVDDGYRDNYENAFPLLRERGMTATFFVVTDFIDEERPLYVSWDQVREMLAGGMSIESHGRNHATLEGRTDDYLVWQALGSLETLQYELGVRPRFVSYPAGDYDANTQRIFASAGYWAAVTTEPGANESTGNLFQLPRVRIHSTTTADQLSALLTMDWE